MASVVVVHSLEMLRMSSMGSEAASETLLVGFEKSSMTREGEVEVEVRPGLARRASKAHTASGRAGRTSSVADTCELYMFTEAT